MDKFAAAVHYIIHQCADPGKLGATRLNKILWFADAHMYQKNGQSITGSRYVCQKHGPVPANISGKLDALESENKIAIIEPKGQYQVREFHSLVAADDSLLSEQEKEIFSRLLEESGQRSASSLSEETHDDIWKAADEEEEIPLSATLVSKRGDHSAEVDNWASRVIGQIGGWYV